MQVPDANTRREKTTGQADQGILFGYAALLTADEFHPYRICAGDTIPPLCRCAPAFLSRERRS